MRVLAIPGSLRSDSHNAKLLYNAARLFPEDAVLDLWGGLKDACDDGGTAEEMLEVVKDE